MSTIWTALRIAAALNATWFFGLLVIGSLYEGSLQGIGRPELFAVGTLLTYAVCQWWFREDRIIWSEIIGLSVLILGLPRILLVLTAVAWVLTIIGLLAWRGIRRLLGFAGCLG